ncbi:uncharacterized protein LOC119108843 [Pollicipes pollicipes]|uniref:uncharacterized protein LOC119108843 n=1 Tax=Pollicipes pollicipes TaxID=41117 RepID=UPI001884D1D0|nr:uncharacterized protein LOC119108843 [Pollicipes pollicipes]XP_037088282.1 uncharacterized protein LOC119108843 [Pollicipes pollicipes]
MPSRCVVPTCQSWYAIGGRHKTKRPRNTHCFRFPKDPAVRSKWIENCRPTAPFEADLYGICSSHFSQADYDPSYLVKRTLMPDVKPRLKEGAIPSLYLPSSPQSPARPRRAGSPKGRSRMDNETSKPSRDSRRSAASTTRASRISLHQNKRPVPREEQKRRSKRNVNVSPIKAAQPGRKKAKSTTSYKPRTSRGKKSSDNIVSKSDKEHPPKQSVEAGTVTAKGSPAEANHVPQKPANNLETVPVAQDHSDAGSLHSDGAHDHPEHGEADQDATEDRIPYPVDVPMETLDDHINVLNDVVRPFGSKVKHVDPSAQGTVPYAPGGPMKTLDHLDAASGGMRSATNAMKAEDSFVNRMKEIFQKKTKIRRLEEKCKRLLGDVSARRVDPRAVSVDADTYVVCERDGTAVSGEPVSVQASTEAGDEPLVVLREQAPPLSFVAKLREHELSDEMTTFSPSDLQEALSVNQRLKIQNLSMQAAFLSWVIKNKRLGDMKVRLAQERYRRKSAKVVTRKRLKELLRLEKSVKSMFTEAQVRAITRDFSVSLHEKKKVVQWGEEDVIRTLELRAISSDEVLNHVKRNMKIPLPSMLTVKQRCQKSPKLNEMYRAITTKRNAEPHCGMCQRALSTIDDVAEATVGRPSDLATSPAERAAALGAPPRSSSAHAAKRKRGRGASVSGRFASPRKQTYEADSEDSDSSDSIASGSSGRSEAETLEFRAHAKKWPPKKTSIPPPARVLEQPRKSWYF